MSSSAFSDCLYSCFYLGPHLLSATIKTLAGREISVHDFVIICESLAFVHTRCLRVKHHDGTIRSDSFDYHRSACTVVQADVGDFIMSSMDLRSSSSPLGVMYK